MIEAIVKDFLKEKIEVPVCLTKSDAKSYCLIEKTGSGRRENFLNRATITIQSYGATLQDAAALNDLVKDYMQGNGIDKHGISAETEVSSCICDSDYNYTDTTRKEPRYQAVYTLYY